MYPLGSNSIRPGTLVTADGRLGMVHHVHVNGDLCMVSFEVLQYRGTPDIDVRGGRVHRIIDLEIA